MGESWASSAAARGSMRGNRRRDTRPEMEVRRRLHAMGLRYRVDLAPLPESRRNRADIVFTRARIAVFIDGCYWHKCPDHYRPARTNADFWSTKIDGNAERDRRVTETLRANGWTVLRFWEHQPAAEVAESVAAEVTSRSDIDE